MKISEKLNLIKSQFELDFVDIDTEIDIPLFIDSNLIRKYDSEFNAKFVETMDSFFCIPVSKSLQMHLRGTFIALSAFFNTCKIVKNMLN